MKKLKESELLDLKKLTSIKKALHAAELSLVQTELAKTAAEIQSLKAPIADGTSVDELNSNAIWQQWRHQEVFHMNSKQARICAEHARIKRVVGKAEAEDATAAHLLGKLKLEKKSQCYKKAESFYLLHFLANNICDKDI